MIITGIALPKNAVYNGEVIWDDYTKLMVAENTPLLLDHLLENRIGKVLDFYVDAQGNLRYIAKVEREGVIKCNDACNVGASIGAKWQRGENERVLYIYELSLTDSPHFIETFYARELQLNKKIQNVSIINHMKKEDMNVKAQLEEFMALVEKVSQLESEIASMKETITSLEQQMTALQDQLGTLQNMASEVQSTVQASKTLHDDLLKLTDKHISDFINTNLKPIVQELAKISKQ